VAGAYWYLYARDDEGGEPGDDPVVHGADGRRAYDRQPQGATTP
jgi:hypothetical protein